VTIPTRVAERPWLVLAAAAGLLHAAFSAYWAGGGTWLLRTVGQWAVELVAERPLRAALLLAGVAVGKAVLAVAPLLLARRRMLRNRWLRATLWLAATALFLYGALNTVVAGLVLAGAVRPDGGYDSSAMTGHALLWDPLFLAWGAFLLLGLRASGRRGQ
jgi:hypothetical protein